jgi:hypothetical protein
MGDDLAGVDLEDRDGHVFTGIREDAGHAQFLCDDARAHGSRSSALFDPLQAERLRA